MSRYFMMTIIAVISIACSSRHKHINSTNGKSNHMATDTLVNNKATIEMTVMEPMRIVFIRDTVPLAGLKQFFNDSYSELYSFAAKQKLVAGKAMAFYDNYNDPMNVEAAIEVGSIPNHLPGRILTRIVEGGNAVVAHYTGPYENMVEPYSQLAEWIKDNRKVPKGLPFEVYLNSPDQVKDSSQLSTDIYQLIR